MQSGVSPQISQCTSLCDQGISSHSWRLADFSLSCSRRVIGQTYLPRNASPLIVNMKNVISSLISEQRQVSLKLNGFMDLHVLGKTRIFGTTSFGLFMVMNADF